MSSDIDYDVPEAEFYIFEAETTVETSKTNDADHQETVGGFW